MGFFNRVALIKAQQKLEPPNYTYLSDLTEIAYLGAIIEKDVEFVTIPVGPYTRNPFREFEKILKREKFDFVGISSMTGGYHSAREYARIAREAGAYVAMGGYHPTAMTKDVLADDNVDAVIRGEGELSLKDLIQHGPSRHVKGLSFKEHDGEPVHNPDQSLIFDLDSLPHPLRRIRPTRFGEKGDQYSIDTVYSSRGCIAKCTFCANNTVNQNLRNRSPEHFIEELEQIHDKNVKKVLKFWDSIFLFDAKRVERIVELMLQRNLTNFRIVTESRSDDVIRCEHLMKDLKRVGFDKIQVGIESPDPETYKRLKKGGSVAKHERAIRIVQDAGLKVEGFLIIGHPHEREEDIEKYPEFAKKLGLNERALFFVMTPYPGTQIFTEYHEKGLIDSYDWSLYNNYGTVVHLEKLSRARLRNMLSFCYGSTIGISNIFSKEKSIPAMILQMFSMATLWNHFIDIQGVSGDEARNMFMSAFFKAGEGSYRKKRRVKMLGKLSQLFGNKFNFEIEIGPKESYVMAFEFKGDELLLDFRPRKKEDKHMIKVTLDELDEIHREVDMIDINAFAMMAVKVSPLRHRFRRYYHCLPVLRRTTLAFARVLWAMTARYWKESRRSRAAVAFPAGKGV